jgi:hypothetical protein
MPPASAPTPAEIGRRLDGISAQLSELAAQMRTDRDRGDVRYVPRVEWVEARKGITDRIGDVASDVADLKRTEDADKAFRRQILLAVSVAAFSALISVAVSVAGFVVGRG